MSSDRDRLLHHAAAILMVAAAAAIGVVVGGDPSAAFLLSGIAITIAAWRGGFASGVVGTLTAILAARATSHVGPTPSLLFLVDGLLLAWWSAHRAAAARRAADALFHVEARIAELHTERHRLLRLDAAFEHLERDAGDCATFLIDESGRVIVWRDSAARQFGWHAREIVGASAARLLGAGGDEAFANALAAACTGPASIVDWPCTRVDGPVFPADVVIRPIAGAGARVFSVVVRDRTREREWQAFAESAAEMHTSLREEADTAQRQLATLQYVTDPALALLPTRHAVTVLLDRLRESIDADGVALIRVARGPRRIVTATDGISPDADAPRVRNDVRRSQPGRILIIHNDPARVEAASAAAWPQEATSLIAVPVAVGTHIEATLEVVGLRARRSTECDIALVQVVAAHVATRLQAETAFGADAVA